MTNSVPIGVLEVGSSSQNGGFFVRCPQHVRESPEAKVGELGGLSITRARGGLKKVRRPSLLE